MAQTKIRKGQIIALTTADVSASTDKNYVTDAQATVIGNTSGTNTGDNAVNSNYSGLVTNATHTGEVTGSGALTLDKTAVSNRVDTVITASDVILFGDATDTGNLKKDTVQGILDLVPAAPTRDSLGLDTDDSPQFAGINLGAASDTTLTRTGAGAIAVEGVAVLLSGGALGTPSSGTLTNATGLPLSGVVDSTSEALGVGTLEVGHASDTTVSRSAAGVIAVEGVVIPSISSTNTLTNKRITNENGIKYFQQNAISWSTLNLGNVHRNHI